jgi:CubicO group peptidase (beta-lactamase class C family)
MQLVEQGKIKLNDKISTYLHDVPDGDKITVKQLLNQNSGFGAYQSLSNLKITDSYGTYQYANVNYGLLGKIIESVSGMSYEEYVTQHIFSPLKMTHSAASLEGSRKNGLIDGYRNFFGIPVAGAPIYPDKNSWAQVSAGYISSSISDMGKYLQMYLNGGENVVSSKSINTVFYDNVPVKPDSPSYYGMGWSLSNEYSQLVLGHSGLVENYISYMFILPESGIGGVILVNTNDYLVANNMIDNIRKSLILMLTGNAPVNIDEHRYLISHLLLDIGYLVIFLAAVLPLLLLSRYKRELPYVKRNRAIIKIGIQHLVLPTALILSPYILATPLWVVRDFVPDLFLTLVFIASLLYISGAIKVVFIRKRYDL